MAKLIIGLVGPIASGKSTAKKYLEEKYGAESARYSTVLRDVLTRIQVPINRDNMQSLSLNLRKNFGEDLLAKAIAHDVKDYTSEVVVVEGIRRDEDIAYLNKLPEFVLVSIDAGPKVRYGRLVTRGENEDDKHKTYAQFLKDHEYETEIYIPGLMKKASGHLDNNGTLEDLYRQLDALVSSHLPKGKPRRS